MASEQINIERAVEQAEAFFGTHVSDEELVYNLVLLTSEAVTNGMKHGNAFDPEKNVTVEFVVEKKRIEISVEDEGGGFVRDVVPDPLENSHLFDSSGRGLFLLESLADEVHYELDGRKTRVVFKR